MEGIILTPHSHPLLAPPLLLLALLIQVLLLLLRAQFPELLFALFLLLTVLFSLAFFGFFFVVGFADFVDFGLARLLHFADYFGPEVRAGLRDQEVGVAEERLEEVDRCLGGCAVEAEGEGDAFTWGSVLESVGGLGC
jgi:hypothetical protein